MKKRYIIIPIVMLAMLAAFSVPVMAEPCGDVNCDGAISMSDARAIIRYDISSDWAADVNCDGAISMSDARAIIRYDLNCCICKVFAEWVNDYSALPNCDDLQYTDEDAEGFYYELDSDAYWDGYHIYGDDDAKERNWKDPNYGGSDIADNAEFAFFAGHGRPTSGGDLAAFIFGTEYDDHYLTCEDALWGNTKMNWIAIDSCEVLSHYELTAGCWAYNAFEGLHSICGWDTACNETTFRGRYFARYMDGTWDEKTIIEAWKQATKDSQGAGYYAAAMAARDWPSHSWDCWDDHLYSHGPSVEPPVNPTVAYDRWDCAP